MQGAAAAANNEEGEGEESGPETVGVMEKRSERRSVDCFSAALPPTRALFTKAGEVAGAKRVSARSASTLFLYDSLELAEARRVDSPPGLALKPATASGLPARLKRRSTSSGVKACEALGCREGPEHRFPRIHVRVLAQGDIAMEGLREIV